jgi:hypothetical protein
MRDEMVVTTTGAHIPGSWQIYADISLSSLKVKIEGKIYAVLLSQSRLTTEKLVTTLGIQF